MKPWLAIPIVLLAGCSHIGTVQEKLHPDGTKEITRVEITTFFDGKTDLAKFRTTSTDKSQGMSVGSVSENASSTNAVELLRSIGAILATMPK